MAADVLLRLRGLMVERFLARALAEGAALYEVTRVNDREASFRCTERDSQKVLALAQKYKLDVAVIETRGLTRLKHRFLRRASLPLSMLLCVALVMMLLSRLWLIELPPGADAALGQALLNMGIRPGIALSAIDTREIERQLYAGTGEYAFVGARLTGIRLEIQTALELPEPDLYDPSGVRDLVAQRDGLLVSLNAFAGEAAAKPGDVVRRGQLLIRGEEKVSDEATSGVCALGEAVARVWISAEAKGSMVYQLRVPTGRVSLESELRLFDYAVPLLQGERFSREQTETERLPVGGVFLPLMIVRTRHIETSELEKRVDEQVLKEQLAKKATQDALNKVPSNAEIVDKWVDYSMIEGDQIVARAVIETRQNIAVSRGALKKH